MAKNIDKIAILTSGGDSMGMNAAIRAAVRYALGKGVTVYGVRHGYIGLIENDIYELDYKSVSNIIQKGGTMLRTGRSDEFKDPEVLKKGIKNNIDITIIIIVVYLKNLIRLHLWIIEINIFINRLISILSKILTNYVVIFMS